MPRLLSLPLSELFTESSGAASSEYFPSPWHGAPLPIALKARQLAEDAALFSDVPGRRNVLVCRAENDDPAQRAVLLFASQSPADFVLPLSQTKRCRWLTALPEKHPAAPLKKLPALWKS